MLMSSDPIFELEIEIPDGVEVQISRGEVKVTGPKGTLSKDLTHIPVSLSKGDKRIVVSKSWPRKRDKAMVGTAAALIRNMIKGVTKGFVYKLKVVYAHFPTAVKVQEKEQRVLIDNFTGEKTSRIARIAKGATVRVVGDEVIVEGMSIDAVSETAAEIQRSTKIKDKDQRVFLDGLYVFEKGVPA